MGNANAPCCEEEVVHQDVLDQVRSKLPPDEVLYDLAELFKMFGDSTRVKILYALLEDELCVCDIARLLDVSQSAVSHQLRVLRQNDLVKDRKEGKVVFYSLDDEHVENVMQQGMAHLRHKRGYHE
jgi:ArsR family transcriptional regulator